MKDTSRQEKAATPPEPAEERGSTLGVMQALAATKISEARDPRPGTTSASHAGMSRTQSQYSGGQGIQDPQYQPSAYEYAPPGPSFLDERPEIPPNPYLQPYDPEEEPRQPTFAEQQRRMAAANAGQNFSMPASIPGFPASRSAMTGSAVSTQSDTIGVVQAKMRAAAHDAEHQVEQQHGEADRVAELEKARKIQEVQDALSGVAKAEDHKSAKATKAREKEEAQKALANAAREAEHQVEKGNDAPQQKKGKEKAAKPPQKRKVAEDDLSRGRDTSDDHGESPPPRQRRKQASGAKASKQTKKSSGGQR